MCALLDLGRVEHGDGVALEELLPVQLLVGRAVRGRIAARAPGDAAPAAPEVAHLVFPAAVVAGELMDEQDRRAATGFLVVDARAVRWGIGHEASSGGLRHHAARLTRMPAPPQGAAMAAPHHATARHARPICSMWRWSVPQQPPSTLMCGWRSRRSPVLAAQFHRIAGIEVGRLVELLVAAARGIGADAADAPRPCAARLQDGIEMGRVGAVDHEVGRDSPRLLRRPLRSPP